MDADRGTAPGERELAGVLRALAWTIHRLVPERAGVEPMPVSELAVLKQILESPGVTVTELARHLGMRQSNTSAAVRGLVERDLVRREGTPVDRRVTRLVPTEKLLAERERIDTVWSGTIRSAMARLGPEQAAALEAASDALQALDQALRAERPEPGAHR
ncbi:winged helix-turn-helix transcriptional regulator [Thermobifida halotolerans]|uniref:Winged helix-turn-helix transcriptional regulator n=2 Tax=Thermobifida halotolerans TaxID=483545 RepID=A0A399G6Y9_9ACTN|nr:MarR family winged helix-turn-helix transcriptional regulator [Thermobifida halotolerans]UOE20335.1 winged helix-turn-helix transcriptional regulator [Thermobifida halotolerans]